MITSVVDYVRYDPESRRYLKVAVPRRQQIGDHVVGVVGVVLGGLLVVGFSVGVLVALATRVFHFF